MGFRFRKSVNIGPLRLNFSKSGVGYSVGVRGLRYTKKANGGTRTTVTVCGTGLSYVAETGAKKSSASSNEGGSLFKPLLGSVTAVLVLILGIAGCSSNDPAPDPQPSTPTAVTQPQQQAEAEQPEEVQQSEEVRQPDEQQSGQAADPEVPDEPKAKPTEPETKPEPAEKTPEPESGTVSESEPVVEPEPEPTPTPAITPTPEPEPAQQIEERKVYRTKSGKRYHYSDSCNGATYYETTLDKALKAGLTPCEKCVG